MANYTIPKLLRSAMATGDFLYWSSGWLRKAIGSAGQKLVVASGIPSWTSQGYPKGHMEGLRLRYSSATAVIVETGSCRNAADDGDLVLSAEATVSITTITDAFADGSGLDRRTLTGTVAQSSGNQNVTGTSTLFKTEFYGGHASWATTARSSGGGKLTGTRFATTSGAATVTGTGTKFLSELAIGDLIEITTGGTYRAARRITAIASDTSLTTGTNWSNTDNTDNTAVCIENALFYTTPTLVQSKVNVITSDTALVSDGVPGATYGGQTGYVGHETNPAWYFPWLVSDGTDTIVILSTQRTTPFLSGITSKRRIGSVINDDAGNLAPAKTVTDGNNRWTLYAEDGDSRMLGAGAQQSWTDVACHARVPPTARLIRAVVSNYRAPAGDRYVRFRERAFGDSSIDRPMQVWGGAGGDETNSSLMDIPCDGAQYVQYANDSASMSAYLDILGYMEIL